MTSPPHLAKSLPQKYKVQSDHSEIDGLGGLVEILSGLGHRVHLDERVDAVEAEPGHELLRREALEVVAADVGHGEVADAGERLHVGRGRARILLLLVFNGGDDRGGGHLPALTCTVRNFVDDLLRRGDRSSWLYFDLMSVYFLRTN